MKNLQVLSLLLPSLLLASMAMAQAGNLPEAPQSQDPSSTDVQLIRSPSAQSSTTKPPSTQTPNESQQSGENKIIAQATPFPRSPRRPMPPPADEPIPRHLRRVHLLSRH